MIPASHMGGGTCLGVPDICKTPTPAGPVPIPYPNTGMNAQTSAGTAASKVYITQQKAVLLNSEIPMSTGDEAGSAGGVVSGKIKGAVKFLLGYPKVQIEKKNPAMLGSLTTHNANNIVGAQIAPSQAKVLYSPVPVPPPPAASGGGSAQATQVQGFAPPPDGA
jgi:hypothetical protein